MKNKTSGMSGKRMTTLGVTENGNQIKGELIDVYSLVGFDNLNFNDFFG
jgi:hypothetical protein